MTAADDTDRVAKIARRIAAKIQTRGRQTRRDTRHALASRERHLLLAALRHALDARWITEEDNAYVPGKVKL